MKKYTIVEITDWEKDDHMMTGDMCHMPEADVYRFYADEYEKKIENGNWPNLPFTCEAESEDDALDKYNETCGRFDYIRAIDAEFEVEGDDEEDDGEE